MPGFLRSAFLITCFGSFLHFKTIGQTTDIYQALYLSNEQLKINTGVYSLEKGGESLFTRLWFFKNAQQSIDIQYYSFAKDATGAIAADYVVKAADRGVKVRILIDDAASRMYSHEIQLLDSHDNIEIRIYNAGLLLGRLDRRLKKTVKNRNRLLRRMHNKTITIDGKATIMGGRNIADEYFDVDDRYNFRDRDVLLLGKAVEDVTISFNKFWNDTLTVVYAELSGKSGKKWYSDANRFEKIHKKATRSKVFTPQMAQRVDKFPEELKLAFQKKEAFIIPGVSFVSDIPGKNEDREKREGGICGDTIVALIGQAKHFIIIQSPYYIIDKAFSETISEAIKRGVKVRLLTNSLSSTDNLEAFSGYQKDRKEILKMGMEVYEFKPASAVRYKLMLPDVQEKLKYKPVYGFHSKTVIIDSAISIVGSFNFDPRSANYNTECISVIRSAEVTDHLLTYIEEEFLADNSWQINLEWNPDKKAGIKKRTKAFVKRLIPKKLL